MKRKLQSALLILLLVGMAAFPAAAHQSEGGEGHHAHSSGQEEIYYVGESTILSEADGHEVEELISSDPEIAVIEGNMIRFLKPGAVTITVRAEGNLEMPALVNVTMPPSEIVLEQESIKLKQGEIGVVTYHVLPEDADQRVRWYSMDENVVQVDEIEGTIKALKGGMSAVVKMITPNGKEARIVVAVSKTAAGAAIDIATFLLISALLLMMGGGAFMMLKNAKKDKKKQS